MFMGSRFANHAVNGKSQDKRYQGDIRKLWMHLEKTEATEYPLDDMVETGLFGYLMEIR